jgi:hypothetical protein
LVARVFPAADLERETLDYAEQAAANDPSHNRLVKFAINQAMDNAGFSTSVRAVGSSFITRHYPPPQNASETEPAAYTPRPAGLDPNGEYKGRIQRALKYFKLQQAKVRQRIAQTAHAP